MRILCTFPGRYGDLLWALPTIRALSRRLGQPIDLWIAGEFASIVPLLAEQPYLDRVEADPSWSLAAADTWKGPHDDLGVPRPAVWQEIGASGYYDAVFHLGYRGWPQVGLPFEVLHTLNSYSAIVGSKWTRFGTIEEAELDLQTPWITLADTHRHRWELAVGFTEAWFELKFGLMCLIARRLPPYITLTPPGTRWATESDTRLAVWETSWIENARAIRGAQLFLGDCSALHVLAVAVGTPAVVMEPMEARWNPIFWPLGMDGPQVTIVRGGDGNPTFDARHTLDTVRRALTRPQETR